LSSPKWVTVPYCYNRGILHDGDFPHFSTEIKSIKDGVKRVILGFNCFSKELAECNLRAPEHSDAFNRTIKLYQKMAAMGLSITSGSVDNKYNNSQEGFMGETPSEEKTRSSTLKKKGGINIEDIKKNPLLAKMIIRAAKAVKEKAGK
jgi:hypothetical protein